MIVILGLCPKNEPDFGQSKAALRWRFAHGAIAGGVHQTFNNLESFRLLLAFKFFANLGESDIESDRLADQTHTFTFA